MQAHHTGRYRFTNLFPTSVIIDGQQIVMTGPRRSPSRSSMFERNSPVVHHQGCQCLRATHYQGRQCLSEVSTPRLSILEHRSPPRSSMLERRMFMQILTYRHLNSQDVITDPDMPTYEVVCTDEKHSEIV
jgi:hypothetical protein